MTSPEACVLVIGGTGFIGSHLVERLASAGYRVHVLARHARWPWGEPPRGVELHRLDVADPSDEGRMAALLGGASAIVNLAGALYRPGLPKDTYRKLHVESAARVAAIARREAEERPSSRPPRDVSGAGSAREADVPSREGSAPLDTMGSRIESGSRDRNGSGLEGNPVQEAPRAYSMPGSVLRLVHVSTTGVLGPTGGVPRDESATPHPTTIYEDSKLAGERAVLERRGDGLEIVVIRPGLVYGPRDLHLLGLYRSLASGTFRLIAGGLASWQPIYVEDAARALEAALEAPACNGEIIHVAGAEQISVRMLARKIAAQLGTRVRGPDLPYGIAMAAGTLFEGIYRPFGLDPPLSRSRVRTLTEDRVYIIDRARDRLGFIPRVGLEEGLARTIAWYRANGYL